MRVPRLFGCVFVALVAASCDRNRESSAASARAEAASIGERPAGSAGVAAEAEPRIAVGEDWSLPPGVGPSANSGFFHEHALPETEIGTRVVDLAWRQLEPRPGEWSSAAALARKPARYRDLGFGALEGELAKNAPYWMRIWLSDVDLAPEWLRAECPGVEPIDASGYEGDRHWPIFEPCVWSHAKALYQHVFSIVAADPNLRFVYVPGSFTYCEFDFDLIAASGVDFETFNAWFDAAMSDLRDAMGAHASKLVYTGEDYPSSNFGTKDDLFARRAVEHGMGIRTGITELFNHHLSHVPAYGTTIAPDGHMVTDESWLAFEPGRVRATENECYQDCGLSFPDESLEYVVEMSNLKALQLRMNWVYVDPGLLARYPDFFRWLRLELGKTAEDSPDAWAILRDAEDVYWRTDESHTWEGKPFVKNWERWLVQRDVEDGGKTSRGTEVHVDPGGEGTEAMGVAYEGRRTARGSGNRSIYFAVDPRFARRPGADRLEIKVSYVDSGASFRLEWATRDGRTAASPVVHGAGTGGVRTATFAADGIALEGSMAGRTDFRIALAGEDDVEIRMVRVVRARAVEHPRVAGGCGRETACR